MGPILRIDTAQDYIRALFDNREKAITGDSALKESVVDTKNLEMCGIICDLYLDKEARSQEAAWPGKLTKSLRSA